MLYRRFDGGFLVVTCDDELATLVAEAIESAAPVRRACAPDAVAAITRQYADWCGFVVDLDPGPESSLELLTQIRETWPTVPVAAVVGQASPARLNAIARLDAQALGKPLTAELFEPFLRRARALDPSTSARGRVVRRMASTQGLTRRETEILRLAVEGWNADTIARCLEIKAKTYESHVTRILRKTGVQRLSELTIRILLEAHGARPDPSGSGTLLRPPTPALGITRDQIRAQIERTG